MLEKLWFVSDLIKPSRVYIHIATFNLLFVSHLFYIYSFHLSDAFIQSDLKMRIIKQLH